MSDHDDHRKSPTFRSSAAGSNGPPRAGGRKIGGKSKAGGLAVLVLVGIYSFAAPQLNDRFGWSLPAIQADGQGNVRMADAKDGASEVGDRNADSQTAETKTTDTKGSERSNSGQSTPSRENDRRVTADSNSSSDPKANSSRSRDQANRPPPMTANSSGNSTTSSAGTADADLRYGILREISADRFISPAGLMYTPGSAEGHRLEHLRRHTKDNPSRPGSHGVFDGDMDGALATIDSAYERAKKNQRTTKKVDKGRTIYTVDMGKRVGYVGGRTGQQRRNPMARRVRIVLEGNRVITAYPM